MPQVSKPEDLQEVGSKIRFLRKEKKMSQLELAEAIGVTQNTIYLIETGQSEMKLGKLFSIAEVLDVTPDKLLPNEAKTTSNKLFEIEYLWKQLGEADQTIMHGVMLSAENKKQFLIPEGFAHGFLVLSDEAEFCYKVNDFWHPNDEGGMAWNDPEIGIEWPELKGEYKGSASAEGYTLKDGTELNLSDKDQKWLGLKDTFKF